MSLRRNIFLTLAWTSILVLFTAHYILTRHDHRDALLHGHTRKNVVLKHSNDNDDITVEETLRRGMDSYVQFHNEQPLNIDQNKNIVQTDVRNNSNSEPGLLDECRKQLESQAGQGEDSISITRFLEEKSKQKALKLENRRLKSDVEKLTKHVESLTLKKKQLKLLVRRLAIIDKGKEHLPKLDPALPWVFAITPTFTRYTQKADLVRLSQTLQHVANLHWIIVEDSNNMTKLVKNVLLDSGLSFTHLNSKTPYVLQRKKGEKYNKHHRGVTQRNLGLKWIRENINPDQTPGVVYFMDDDNTYHKQIFNEVSLRKTYVTKTFVINVLPSRYKTLL